MSEAKQSRYTPVPIEISGRRYVIRYTWGRLRDLRDRTDGRLDILGGGLRGATADDFPLLLWAGISHARDGGDPSIEPEHVEAMLADVDLAEYEALDRAVLQALGIDVDALRDAVQKVAALAAIEEAAQDPLPSPTASGIPTSSSGASPSPSSGSAPTSSGDSLPASTPQSATHGDGIATSESPGPTTGPQS